MRLGISVILITIVALTAGVSQASESVIDTMSYAGFENFESRVSELESRVAAVESNGGSSSCALGPGNSWCEPCAGLTFMAEVIWLRPYDSLTGDLTSSFEDASRFTLGYVGEGGWGARVRYFELGVRDFAPPSLPSTSLLNLEVVDMEMTGRFRAGCGWWGTVSGGLRYADFNALPVSHYSDTWGPVIGLEMGRTFRCNVRLYGLVRQSYQFGDEDTNIGDTVFGISELQLGAEWNRTTSRGTNFFFRSFVEAQRWDNMDDTVLSSQNDLGLIGGGLALGITR